MKTLVIAGIGTGIGKTMISAIVVEALKADYWKPIQAGDLDNSDTRSVQRLTSNTHSVFHPEAYRLNTPMSPHAAAEIDGLKIDLDTLSLPQTENNLVIELAGGLMVPLNDEVLNIDLLNKWNVPVVLVSQNYLGSINHTLLSLELLKSRAVRVAGIIFNGEANKSTEDFILKYSRVKCIANIPTLKTPTKEEVKKIADRISSQLLPVLH